MPGSRWLNGPTARRERDARRADAVPIVFAGPLQVKLPDGTLAASGETVLVAWDPVKRGKRALSDAELAVLS